MIKINDIKMNNAENKTFLYFSKELTFNDNTVYFIIGRSGVGKTSIVDFITSPFTDDPVKSGGITLHNDIAPRGLLGRPVTQINVINSFSRQSGAYFDFIRRSVAFIPQKTDSFHPAIPLSVQMYNYYKTALPPNRKPDWNEFSALVEELSPFAGWDKIQVDTRNRKQIRLFDTKEYIDEDSGEIKPIVNLKGDTKINGNLSTGQFQRILILMGLIQFRVSETPVLIGDEFLVNFTYMEANEVLKDIITFFKNEKKKHKLAIFILHDLSFDFLKDLPQDINVKLIAIDKENYKTDPRHETSDVQKINAHEIDIVDFYRGNWKDNSEIFRKFKDSYDDGCIPALKGRLKYKRSDGYLPDISVNGSRPYPNVYGPINLKIKKNRFIVITGFSGCGKSTLCNQYINENIADNKKIIRYFPSKALSSLSHDSQISIQKDLSIIYAYYNGIESLYNCKKEIKDKIKETIMKVRFFYEAHNINDIDDKLFGEFLNKKIFDLSGGQQQRYWLSRILLDYISNSDKSELRKAELLILDESIASLDCITKNEILEYLIKEIFCKRGITILFVSHDLRDIGVIYNTLASSMKNKINDIFEHYEMIDGGLYKVNEDFPTYKENLKKREGNKYQSIISNTGGYKFRLNTRPRKGIEHEDKIKI
jgi:ABC-type dipeptide/oligopeptide/nickel transport system ATPase subunit